MAPSAAIARLQPDASWPGAAAAARAPRYRPDIDGLRAIAVIAVILFHVRLPGAAGGYVGVDVFFVISGYLITDILWRDIRDGRFTFAGFYERRIRRLIPALAVLCAVTLGVAAVFFMPFDFKDLAQSAAATGAFAANLFFWHRSGYFDHAVDFKPLVHLWSLGVEEQFYIAWPAFLVLAHRFAPRLLRPAVLTLTLGSLVLAILLVALAPRAAFYMPFSRAWELLLGAMLALGMVPALRRRGTAIGILGLVLILLPVAAYDATTPFPGLAALPPCLGAALIIASAGGSNRVTGLLSIRPLVAIGRISYSLYLWHWPMLVLPQYYLLRDLTAVEKTLVVAASVLLAAASYRYVEMPFRRGRGRRPILFAGTAALVAATLAIGITATLDRGFPGRLPADVAALALAAEDTNPDSKRCDRRSAGDVAAGRLCRLGDPAAPPSFALFGDSFADALMPGIAVAAGQMQASGHALGYSGCLPLPGVAQPTDACNEFVEAATAFLVARPEIGTIVLIGRWTSAVSAVRFGAYGQDDLYLTDDRSIGAGAAENARVVEHALDRLIAALPGRTIVIVAYVPEQSTVVPRELGVRALRGLDLDIGVPRAVFERRQAPVQTMLDRLAQRHPGLVIADAGAVLCPADPCPARAGGVVYYADDNHVSARAAAGLGDMFAAALAQGLTTAAGRRESPP